MVDGVHLKGGHRTYRPGGGQRVHSAAMAYPSKTGKEAILNAALAQVATAGADGLSIRGVAAALGLAPNALYRYFPDRAALEAAVTAHGAAALHDAMRHNVGRKAPVEALRAVCRAYMKFSRDDPHIYEMLMRPCDPVLGDVQEQIALWDFFVERVADVSGGPASRKVAIALWAMLHGLSVLEMAPVLGAEKTGDAFDFGLDAIVGAAQRKA